MRVLIACEFSGTVRDAFTRAGHDATSCDLLPTESPGQHYQGDVFDIIGDGYDLMVAHPPCTYLTNSGVRWLHSDPNRWQQLIEGAVFFRRLLNAPIPRIAIENPVMHGYATSIIGTKHSQLIQPWMFGHPEQKGTGLWLKNLPPLIATEDVRGVMDSLPVAERNRIHWVPQSADRWKIRSVTYSGIAEALAQQYGSLSPIEVAA